jgi:hypothetical protein
MAKKGTRKGATKTQRSAKNTGRRTGAAKKTAAKRTSGAKKTSRKRTAGAKKSGGKRTAAKREVIDTGTDKRYVRRGAAGRFKESDDVGRSLSRDVRRKAKTKVKSGQGDRGDR